MNARDRMRHLMKAAVAEAVRSVPQVQQLPGTVESSGPDPTVIIDGDTESIPVELIGDPPGPGQRVVVQFHPGGGAFIAGSGGGAWRLYEYDQRLNDSPDIDTETELQAPSCEVEILHPSRVIRISVCMTIETDTADRSAIVRCYRDTIDPDNLVGRLLKPTIGVAGASQRGSGFVLDLSPDPGVVEYILSVEQTGGAGTVKVLAAGAGQAAQMTVEDIGPDLHTE